MHDEAYLYINQGITQEDPKIGRSDVALIMWVVFFGVFTQITLLSTNPTLPLILVKIFNIHIQPPLRVHYIL